MKVSKEKAVKVFEYFGFKMAVKWNAEKMTEKLTNLIGSIDPNVKIKSKKVKTFVDELLAADSIIVATKKKDPEPDETTDQDADQGKSKGKKKDKKKAEKKDAPAKKRGITRLDAAVKVLMGMKKKGLTTEEVVSQSDALYVVKGGTSNLNESNYSFKLAARVLEVAELVTFSEDRSTVKPA